MIESIEARHLLTASVTGSLLSIGATDGNDIVEIAITSAGLEARINGINEMTVAVRKVTHIHVDAGSGKDLVNCHGVSIPTWIEGGAGNDSLVGGEGNDTLVGGSGRDVLIGNGGDDALGGGANADKIDGGAGADTLGGGGGNDKLHGGSGDDFLHGGDGSPDLIYGGAGDADLVDYSDASQECIISLDNVANDGAIALSSYRRDEPPTTENDNVFDDVENVLGSSAHANIINGSAMANLIIGGDGYDSLHGSYGDDTLLGGDGGDTLAGGPGADVMDGGRSGIGTSGDVADYTGRLEDLMITLNDTLANDGAAGEHDQLLSIENVIGGYGADSITGTDGPNMLIADQYSETQATGGDDTIRGLGGDDSIGGGIGSDLLDGGDGNDHLTSSGGLGFGLFPGANSGGLDTLLGGEGDDTLTRGEVLHGGAGNDSLEDGMAAYGDSGDDVLSLCHTMHGGDGNDSLFGQRGFNDSMFGDAGDDLLCDYGSKNWQYDVRDFDTFNGGAGNDTVRLDGGNDDQAIDCEAILPPV